MERTITLLCLLMLAGSACADNFSLSYYFFNINTLDPISNVSATFTNNTIQYQDYSDTNGLAYFPSVTTGEYSILFLRSGYITQESTENISTNRTENVYMYPISIDGIIRLNGFDMTFQNRDMLVYFRENGRLHNRYSPNATILLLTNREYIFVPELSAYDITASPETASLYLRRYGGLIAGGVGILFLILFTTIIGWVIIKKGVKLLK